MRQKYILWSIIIIFTILPIRIDIVSRVQSHGLSSIAWSLYIVPTILIMIMYPRWKVIIGTAIFYSFLKYTAYFYNYDAISIPQTRALILESFVSFAILLTVSYLRIENNKLLKQQEKLIIIDALTGLCNRRYFDLYMEKVIPLSKRMNSPFSLIMIDVDRFKKVNDTYGHVCGDEALKHISNIIKHTARSSDAYVRFGGEEFAIVLPRTLVDEAQIIAERIREAVEHSDFIFHNKHIPLTISLGVAEYEGEQVEEFIEKSDKALYSAKVNGRNQVMVYAEELNKV
ncbi:GGDEF domain-containing protein [Sporosarcina sp. CAU 1771]